jgi:hypothetical protein
MRCLATWLLFILGDLVWRSLWLIGGDRGYPLYNWLMTKSVDMQGWRYGRRWPWSSELEDE